MRRPVKPFVTEYRGGSRRPSGHGSGPGMDLFKSEPNHAVASQPSLSWAPPAPSAPSEPQEDGYEAALRAADALLSGKRAAPAAPAPVPALSTEQPAPPAPAGESVQPFPPTSGRILRAIDEPPSPEMLELQRLEAEHASKKRGRKPGSKNKPKVAALVSEPIEDEEEPVAPPPPAAAPVVPVVSVAAALAARAIATAPRKVQAAAPNERYAWVRTRLKPGQQWKRRLPKVAW
jgi:RNA binding Region